MPLYLPKELFLIKVFLYDVWTTSWPSITGMSLITTVTRGCSFRDVFTMAYGSLVQNALRCQKQDWDTLSPNNQKWGGSKKKKKEDKNILKFVNYISRKNNVVS